MPVDAADVLVDAADMLVDDADMQPDVADMHVDAADSLAATRIFTPNTPRRGAAPLSLL